MGSAQSHRPGLSSPCPPAWPELPLLVRSRDWHLISVSAHPHPETPEYTRHSLYQAERPDSSEGAQYQGNMTMLWLVALCVLVLGVTELDCASHHARETRGDQPGFDEHLPSNVTVQQGDTAYLHCRIFNAENM